MAATLKNISKTNQIRHSANVTFGDVTYFPGGSLGPRIQPDYQIVAMHEGAVVISIDGTEQSLPSRHVALLKPGHREHFAFSRSSRAHHTWCAVRPHCVARSLAQALAAAPFSLPLSARMQHLIELGLSSAGSQSPAVNAQIDKLGAVLLYQYLAEFEPGSGQAAPLPEPLRRAKERVEKDFSTPLAVSELARVACCTSNHLTKLFRHHLGITPSRYLWRTRTDCGVELLRQTGISISEIAYRSGFQTPFHFSRLVKQRHGVSPKELRLRNWNAQR